MTGTVTGEPPAETTGMEIAVIGLSCRFPGAPDASRFWENLLAGEESVTRFTRQDLAAQGVPSALLDDPAFVPAHGVLEDSGRFDAEFFGISPREADLMDPQHRVLLEASWHALEDAGYDPAAVPGTVGVYAGAYYNTYAANLAGHIDPDDIGDAFARDLANEKDYLATRIAYKLGLNGPAVTVQTACSTSLVAVHLACQALLTGSCDVALAGGATVRARQAGYVHQRGGIYSADGHCRPFDAHAEGTVAANGVGVVALKRLQDAIADGDPVRAVILGSAVGNDGAARVGFTAPGADGQARVLRQALDAAAVEPGSVSYIEAHGSATPIGDPIEVEALARVYATAGPAGRPVAIGSVKGNIGHTHAASGVAGLIKTVLALQHRRIPPSINFERPNPLIGFAGTPFRVAAAATPWESDGAPRRAAVSSFGMGGTGAHVVLQEAPSAPCPAPDTGRRRHLLPLSARTPEALEAAAERLAERLERTPEPSLDAVARTLQTGRRHFRHRRVVVARDAGEAVAALRGGRPRGVHSGLARDHAPSLAFAFPGLGDQYPGMGRELYAAQPVFRDAVDRCARAFRPHLGLDLRTLLHPPVTADSRPRGGMDLRRMLGRGGEGTGATPGPLDRTLYAQPATFTVEYALACLWESWGVRPDALIGYSLGEYVAACLAGVFGFEEAVALVAHRARLVDALPAGAMLAVPLPEQRVRELLAEGEGVYLAAVNGPGLCVVSGTDEAVAGLAARLSAQGVAVRPLRTTHAFHSALMEPVAERFGDAVAAARPQPPRLPYVSNVTGDWVTADQARDPAFWVRHLVEPVRFGDGAARLWDDPDRLVLEVGPGQTLGSLALGVRPRGAEGPGACASLPGEYDAQSEEHFILRGLGRLWAAGVAPQWPATATAGVPARVSLPGYPFQGRRHWLEGEPAPAPVPAPVPSPAGAVPSLARKADLADWFHVPVWEPIAPHPVSLPPSAEAATSWLLLLDDEGVGSALGASLVAAGHRVVTVRAADSYGHGPDGFRIDPAVPDHYHRLVEDLLAAGGMPRRVVHLWSVGPSDGIERGLERGLLSVLRLNRAAAGRCGPLDLTLVSSDAHAVLGTEVVAPEKATLSGPALVLPLEQEGTTCRVVDMSMASARDGHGRHVAHLLAELLEPAPHPLVCLRGSRRWSRGHRPVRLVGDGGRTAIRERGTYLITGGFGGIGRSVARHLATAAKARLVLVGRVPLPPLEEWDALRATAAQDDPVADRVRFVQELEERGAEVLAVDADVTDPGRMDEVATLAVARFGAVHGIIHAAGVPAAGPAQLKRDADVLRVLAPKVRGATVVDGLARRLRPDFIVLCSSTLALTGGIGQVDYVAANAFLDALAHRNDVLGGPRTLAVDWDGWQEVGMAARLLGPAGGPRERHSVGPVDHPLLRECLADDGDTAVYRVPLSVESSWLVDEHRMAGSAVVPGTGHLELVRAAHEHQTGAATAELRDVTFLAPVVVGENRQTELRVVLDKTRTPYRFTVVARQEGRHEDAADAWRVHATGAVGPLPETAVRRHDVARLIAEGELKDIGAVEHRGPMGFGPRSRCLRRVHLGPGGALAELELPDEFTGDLDRIHLHPSLLDLAAGFHGMNLAEEFRIPLSYGRLLLHAPLPRRFFSHHRFHDADRPGKQTHTADITLFDDTGREVARVERFVLKRVPGLDERIASLRDGTSADVVPYRLPAVGTRTLREGTLSDHLAQGILPDEGVEALVRLLASGIGPQVAVVAKDLDAVYADIRRSAGPRHPSGPAGAVEPPSAGTGAQDPEPTEENLARLWSELLGVPRVGPHDNFFELGGHSLLGLQMVARIRDRFGVDLPLSTPFEALTVAELSPVLRAARDGRPAPAHA